MSSSQDKLIDNRIILNWECFAQLHSKLCDQNEHLDGLKSSEALLNGIPAND